MSSRVLLFLVLVLVSPQAGVAESMCDSFEDGDYSDFWEDASGCGSISEHSGRMNLTKNSGCVGNAVARWQSQHILSGDFNVEVDFTFFSFSMPDTGYRYHSIKVFSTAGGVLGGMERWRSAFTNSCTPYQDAYKFYANGTNSCTSEWIQTSDSSGKFRLSRSGSTFRAYYWSGTSWILGLSETVPTASVRIWLTTGTGSNENSGHSVGFDNLRVNSCAEVVITQDMIRDAGTGDKIVVSWDVTNGVVGERTQAYLSDLPGGGSSGFLAPSDEYELGQSPSPETFVYVFKELEPYVPYYVSVRTFDETTGEWSDYETPIPDIPEHPSIPVFLLHGIFGYSSIWGNEASGFHSWLLAENVGYIFAPQLNNIGFPGDTYWSQAAGELSSAISSRLDEWELQNEELAGEAVPITSFDVVAHSMGGLIARRLVSQAGQSREARNLITLGSPHAGVKSGDFATRYFPGVCAMWPGLCNMSQSRTAAFNYRYYNLYNSKLYAVGGTAVGPGSPPDVCSTVPLGFIFSPDPRVSGTKSSWEW
ncbi:MAG: hypothetical protein ABIJ00_08335 [Candidatus Eisenbacteria bacterium]